MKKPIYPFSFTTLLTSAAVAQAQPSDAKRAEVLFNEAREALVRGDYARACPRFEASFRLDPAAGTLLNLGDCEERQGKLAVAWRAFRRAQAILPASDKRAQYALQRQGALEPRVGRLVFSIPPGRAKGLEILVDGESVPFESNGMAQVAVEPGRHVVVVRYEGREEAPMDVSVKEGEQRSVALDQGREPPVHESPQAGQSSDTAPKTTSVVPVTGRTEVPPARIGAYFALIGGSLSVVGGAITGLMVLSDVSTYRDHCPNEVCTDQIGSNAASRGKILGFVSPSLFLVGAASIGLGTYLLLRTPSKITVSAIVDANSGTLFAQGRF